MRGNVDLADRVAVVDAGEVLARQIGDPLDRLTLIACSVRVCLGVSGAVV